jgi:hypothetical protein
VLSVASSDYNKKADSICPKNCIIIRITGWYNKIRCIAIIGCGPLGDGLRHCAARYGCVERKHVPSTSSGQALSEVEGTFFRRNR